MNNQQSPTDPDNDPQPEQLHILCVDDEANVLRALRRLFANEPYKVLTASSGEEGLEILQRTDTIGLILSDQRMPEMTGAEFLQVARTVAPDIPRMILTGYADVAAAIAAINDGGALRFLVKPWNTSELLLAVRDGLQRYQLLRENQRLNELVHRQKAELEEWNASLKSRVLQQTTVIRKKIEETHQYHVGTAMTGDAIVRMFGNLLENRCSRTSKHSRNVAELVQDMGDTLKLPRAQVEEFRKAALLHDVGLLGLPDRAFGNYDLMNADDTAEFRAHAVIGQELMELSEELKGIGVIIRHHHEEFNGKGFPDGLAGEQIPLGARLIHIASFIDHVYLPEVFSDAKYQVTRKLNVGMGTRFDPALAAAANHAVQNVLVAAPWQRTVVEQEVMIKDLAVGMVLTRDLYSSRGVLILERDSGLTAESLKSIQENHLQFALNRIAHVRKSVC